MGCGQSKIHLYPRKSKSKANGKKGGHVDSDAETDEDEGHFEEKCANRDQDSKGADETDDQTAKDAQDEDQEVSVSLLRAKNLSLLQSQEISSSQQNFFRMLDKKIEEGPDYDSASETEIALEEARLNALVQHWESVSLTASMCSSASRSQQTTPVRQVTVKQLAIAQRVLMPPPTAATVPQHVLNASDLLPHGALQATNQLLNAAVAANALPKLTQATQQQLLLTQMNTMNARMLQQMAAASQLQQLPAGLSLVGGVNNYDIDTVDAQQHNTIMQNQQSNNNATNAAANTSNQLTLMGHMPLQAPPQHHYNTHLMTLPAAAAAGTSQLLPTPNVSPRRLTTTTDGRIIMNSLAAQQQMQTQQQQMQSQYLANAGGVGVGVAIGLPPTANVTMSAPPPLQQPQSQSQQTGTAFLMDATHQQNSSSGSSSTAAGSAVAVASMPMQLTCYANATQQQQLQHQQLQQQHASLVNELHLQQQQQYQTSTPPPPPQNQSQQYYGDVMHNMQATQPPPPTEYRFPPAISVQRLAPQVQRQLRETQELIKDSCPLYAAGYGSPGPPMRDQQNRNPTNRRPTLETQFSQELS